MPSPREIATKVNDPSMFVDADAGYDSAAGCPTAVAGNAAKRDEAANPTNPSAQPAPCTNMKR